MCIRDRAYCGWVTSKCPRQSACPPRTLWDDDSNWTPNCSAFVGFAIGSGPKFCVASYLKRNQLRYQRHPTIDRKCVTPNAGVGLLVRRSSGPARYSITRLKRSFHFRRCRRPIEKSPLAQIQRTPCAVFGVAWGAADDGDYDEPFGDRSDERFARSGGRPDQGIRGSEVDGAWAPPGLTAGEGLSSARPRGAGVQSARQAGNG